MERFLRYNKICDEKLPLLVDDNTMKLVKISLRITKDVKLQNGRQLWLKNRSRY